MTEAAITDPRIEATDNVGKTLLVALIAELRTMKEPWDDLTQQQQEQRIERLRQNVKHLVRSLATVMFAGDFPACAAQLVSVNFSDGIKATLKISKSEKSRHEVADRVGSNVILVAAEPDRYLDGVDEVRAAAAQRDMFTNERPSLPPADLSSDIVARALDKAAEKPPLFGSLDPGASASTPSAPAEPYSAAVLDLCDWLVKAGNPVEAATVSGWNMVQREAAMIWAKRKSQYAATLQPMPPFIPLFEVAVGPSEQKPAPEPDSSASGEKDPDVDDGAGDDDGSSAGDPID